MTDDGSALIETLLMYITSWNNWAFARLKNQWKTLCFPVVTVLGVEPSEGSSTHRNYSFFCCPIPASYFLKSSMISSPWSSSRPMRGRGLPDQIFTVLPGGYATQRGQPETPIDNAQSSIAPILYTNFRILTSKSGMPALQSMISWGYSLISVNLAKSGLQKTIKIP